MSALLRDARVAAEPLVLACRAPATAAAEPAETTPAPIEDPVTVLRELRKQAFDDGYRDGFAAGNAEGRAALDAQAEDLRAAASAVREAVRQAVAGQEDALVEMAFTAVCRVLGEAAVTQEGVRGAVRQAMREVQSRERLVLRVPPHAYRCLTEDVTFQESGAEILPDERVGPAGCLIETAGGTLDARLEVQLQQLAVALAAARDPGAQ
jgi:flagellar assembly protein FliH